MYHVKPSSISDAEVLKGVELSTPLVYADRFRIRHPGVQWDAHPPHIDGGGIERWEDPYFRSCFENILNGEWTKHDPYDLTGRLNAKTSLYGRPGQVSSRNSAQAKGSSRILTKRGHFNRRVFSVHSKVGLL